MDIKFFCIVVIGGFVMEIVYVLGEEVRLVGCDLISVYLLEVLKFLDMGYICVLFLEGVFLFNFDLILVLDGVGLLLVLEMLKLVGV